MSGLLAPARPLHRSERRVMAFGLASVLLYIGAWAAGGIWARDYHPTRQAISELFAIGAQPGPARLLVASLAISGVALVAVSAVLDRVLPGSGRAGPLLAALSGICTAIIVAFPCTATCPGAGASLTDTLHTVIAGLGYSCLVLAPIVLAGRLRAHAPSFAALSVVVAGAALVGFALHVSGAWPGHAGLQQRLFNTAADGWYIVTAALLLAQPPQTAT